MRIRLVAVVGLALVGCEHIDEIAEVGSPQMPPATEEPQRINVDEIGPKVVRHTGVAPVRTPSLADPQFTLPRQQTTAFEDAPPPDPTITEATKWFAGLSATERRIVGQICREGRRDPCFGMLAPTMAGTPTRMEQLMAQLGSGGDTWTVYDFCRERDPSILCDTPLVVAFDSEPVVFESGSATFAFQPGKPVSTDWPSAATPWIALDRDGDGAITSGAELFGDATVLPGDERARNGFEALAPLDANRDGVLDRRDPMFAQLVLWADRDGDRTSSASELRPLSDVIVAIPLGHEIVPRCTRGNCEGERGVIRWREPGGRERTGAVIDVYLRRR